MRRVIAFLTVVLLVFAACGGEKDTTTTTQDKAGEQTATQITYTCACGKEKTLLASDAAPS